MKKLAPVALFAFNRLDHFSTTLQALAKNKLASDTLVHVFLDGPNSESDRSIQTNIIAFLNSGIEKNFASLQLTHSEKNKGLAQSIVTGVTELINQFGRVIVLEDDLVTSPYFLEYMNLALDHFERNEEVISIHSYVKPTYKGTTPFFLKGADCWGWATWTRGWSLFEADGSKLLAEIRKRNLEYEFNYNGTYDYIGMLKGQISGKNSSWAIRWYASAFLKNKLTLYPAQSLVKNIGMDGSGAHCSETKAFDVSVSDQPVLFLPEKIEASPEGYRAYCDFNRSIKVGLLKRVLNKTKKVFFGEARKK